MTNDKGKICKRCSRPVEKSAESYDIFEQMHWLCFHLEYEHDADPDVPCRDISCPWWRITVYENKLKELGMDVEDLVHQANLKRNKP